MSPSSAQARNVNSKHLKKGDPLPPFNGTLRVYNMRYCPYAQRTILALNAKGLEYEVVHINLMDKPEWLATKSAFTKVPAVELKDGLTVFESLITVEYLDDIYPEKRLQSADPLQRAYDKMLIESISPLHASFYKLLRGGAEVVTAVDMAAYFKAINYVTNELTRRGTKYFSGDKPGFPDYMIWPWFERLPVFSQMSRGLYSLDTGKYGLLLDFMSNMREDPAVSQYLIEDDIYLKYFASYMAGEPHYDLLVEN